MPNLNIHWKGYPHYRLPRIRVVSARRNLVQNRSLSTTGQSSRTHPKIENEKENKKRHFRIQFRRQRMRGSRASSSVLRARRRASVRARQNIQVFGWDTPGAELASRVTEKTGSGHWTQESRSRSSGALRKGQEDSAIPSTDGAASSVARRLNSAKKKSENAYSLRHIAKVPVYWTADHPSKIDKASYNPDKSYSAQRSGPLQATSNQILSRRSTEGRRICDTRIDPYIPIAGQRRRSSSRPRFKANTFRKATSQVSPTRKDTGFSSPKFWEAVRVCSQQSRPQAKSGTSLKSAVQSLHSETSSRSPSQKKVLARFTKEIELYLQAAKAHPSQSLVSSLSTPSSTTLSVYTIQELKPYQSEFQIAGLAVTSAEQKGMARFQKGPSPPPTPPKDDKFVRNRISTTNKNNDKKKEKSTQEAKYPSYASGSTGTTVLGWTPPHEKIYERPSKGEKKRPSASTDRTIAGSNPGDDRYSSPPRPAREAPISPRTSPKKSLPWLRKPAASSEASPTKKLSGASVNHEQHRPSTPLGGWVSIKDTAEPTDERENSHPTEKSRSVIPQGPTLANREDLNFSSRKSTATKYMNQVVDEMARESSLASVGGAEQIRPQNDYVHIGTQTDISPMSSRRDTVLDNQAEHEPEIVRAPVSSLRSKTFPLKSNNCKGDCMQPLFEPYPPSTQQRSYRPSKVMWEGMDRGSRATMESSGPEDVTELGVTQYQPSFESNALKGERTRTFPFTTIPARHIGPYQGPPQPKSPQKSIDEGNSKEIRNDEEPCQPKTDSCELSSGIPPSRHSLPPLCAQCAGPLNPNVETKPISETESKTESPVHACTARSSYQCQQCFPSRNSSVTISPLQVALPAEARAPVEVQYLPSRRSTRPTIPAENHDCTKDLPGPREDGGDSLDTSKNVRKPEGKRTRSKAEDVFDTPESYYSPERTRIQSLAELAIEEYTSQEPVADPMKRPSIPRLKARPVISIPPKHVHCYSTFSRPLNMPQLPVIPTVDKAPCPASPSTVSAESCSAEHGPLNEKQVFKGLHVATAAACDEDVDKWIEEITGSSARKFLSELSAFDGLGVNTLAGVARRAAKQRRDRLNAWEVARQKRIAEQYQKLGCEDEDCDGEEYMLGDQDVVLRSRCSQVVLSGDRNGRGGYMVYDQGVKKEQEELTKSMSRRRECKGSEGARERAVKMGWRERSVSEGV